MEEEVTVLQSIYGQYVHFSHNGVLLPNDIDEAKLEALLLDSDDTNKMKLLIDVVDRNDVTGHQDTELQLSFNLPLSRFSPDYPDKEPPKFALKAPWLETQHLNLFTKHLHSMFELGEPCIFDWLEWLTDNVASIRPNIDHKPAVASPAAPVEVVAPPIMPLYEGTIYHGEPIVDRKSIFVGHIAHVTSISEVHAVLHTLLQDKKIAKATHNMYAYRYHDSIKNVTVQDNDDDGENMAGRRLAHLLELMHAKNALVIVTRWYGGIHLGSDRFRHINNCARDLVEKHGFSSVRTTK